VPSLPARVAAGTLVAALSAIRSGSSSFDFLRYRAALAIMLAVATTGAEDYRTARPRPPLRRQRRTRRVPPDVWSVFTHPGAEQRIRRLLALPGQPGLNHAARQLGIRTAILTSQVRQLETTVGTALPRAGPDGRLTLTAYGERFARDVRPALESLAQSRKSKSDNHGTLSRPPPGVVHLPGNQATESCSTTTKRPAHGVQVHAIPTVRAPTSPSGRHRRRAAPSRMQLVSGSLPDAGGNSGHADHPLARTAGMAGRHRQSKDAGAWGTWDTRPAGHEAAANIRRLPRTAAA